MGRAIVLIAASVILAVFVFIIEINLRGGERKISDGHQKLARYDIQYGEPRDVKIADLRQT